jgi:hypothetical protein
MMEKKDDPTATNSLPEVKKPFRYEDFVKPNPYIKSWMEPYFPKNCFLRDALAGIIACIIAIVQIWIFFLMFGNAAAAPALILALIICVAVLGNTRGRYMAATILFRMEQNNAPKK